MEISFGKVLAKPPVSSLGGLAVMLVFKRRQIGIRVSIEFRYIDVFSRMQIEKLIKQYKPTMLLVEHDVRFRETLGIRVIEL